MARKRKAAIETDPDFDGLAAPVEDPHRAAMAEVAAGFKSWKPAREVLVKVRAVPTIFPQYDRATRCYGHPIERVTIVHGPSGHGKTMFTHGLGLSFLRRGHFYGNVDAEYTTPSDWLQALMAEYADHPGFVAIRPDTYEQTVDAVRSLVTGLAKARKDGKLRDDTSALVVVDSLRKLVPEDFWAKIHRHGAGGDKGSVDGMSGRGAQVKAKMNADWLDELTPLLARTGTAFLAVARESEDVNADAKSKMNGWDWKMTGGKAIEFDASLLIRITRGAWVFDPAGGGEGARVVGERHRITIRKTKVSGKDDKNIVCNFHTSNGVLVPPGFDTARDLLELAKTYEMVEVSGSWLKWGSHKWQGESAAVRKLTADPALLARLDAAVRERFRPEDDVFETEPEAG